MSAFDSTYFRAPSGPGLHPMQLRDEGARELSSWRLHLEPGTEQTFTRPGEETAVIVQQGTGRFSAAAESWEIARSGVFEQPATALYLPSGEQLTVAADTALEAVLVSTPVADGGSRAPAIVRPEDVEVLQRGSGAFEREIHNIFLRDPHFQRLLVGETFNPPGKWSSYPPHKHDGRNGEPFLEEVYHYRLDPGQGFGLQVLYAHEQDGHEGGETVHRVKDRDAVLLPYGYHPVAAAPGYRLCYLWILSGEQRQLALYEDPDHVWTHDAPDGR